MDPAAQLKKLEAERERLREEESMLTEAMSSKQACEECVLSPLLFCGLFFLCPCVVDLGWTFYTASFAPDAL